MPRLLDKQLNEVARLRPVSMSLTLNTDELSTATLTLLPQDVGVQLGDWIRITTPNGTDDVYCVRSIETDAVAHNRIVEVEHVFGVLMDYVARGEYGPSSMGGGSTTVSAENAIRFMLSKQPEGETWWRLGECAFDVAQGWTFSDLSIYQALTTITQSLPNWAWRFDTSALPFNVDLVHRPTEPTCEMRMNRNISTMTMTVDKSGMVTRIYPVGSGNITLPEPGYVERNVDVWGVISKVQTDDAYTSTQALERWANEQLDVLAVPRVRISISGLELSALTGEPMDRLLPGTVCRVPLPEFKTTVQERIITLSWGDMIADPMAVKVTMANSQDLLTNVVIKLDAGVATEEKEAKAAKEKAEKAQKEAKEAKETSSSTNQRITVLEATRISDLETATARLEVTADAITGTVQKFQYNNAGDMLDAWGTKITQAATGVDIEAVWAGVDENTGRIESAESLLSVHAGEILLMVKKDEVNSYIDLTGDGVTIAGGTISLNGAVVFDKIEGYIDSHLSTGTLGVGSITGGSADFDELQTGSINGTDVHLCTMTVGKTVVGQFFGPEDITFDPGDIEQFKDAINAARREGADSVTMSSSGWQNGEVVVRASNDRTYTVSLPSFQTSGGTSFNSEHKTTVNFSTQSVGVPLASATVDASSVYDSGYDAGHEAGVTDGRDAGYTEGFNAVRINYGDVSCTNTAPNTFQVFVRATNGSYQSRVFNIKVGQ